MAKVSLATIKNWFKTGLKPTQAQFWDTWDSFWHKDELIPADRIENLQQLLIEKADAEALANHNIAANAHSALFALKVDKVAGFGLSENNLTNEMVAKINAFNSANGSRIIQGGFAILPERKINLFIYKYEIAGEYFDIPIVTQVQLAVGGAEDRIDAVVINTDSQAVVHSVEDADPAFPEINIATELLITWRLMKAGATEPDGVTFSYIFNENTGQAGGEWDATTNASTRVDFNGTTSPSDGAKSVTVTQMHKYDSIIFGKSTAVPIESDGALQLTINLQEAWGVNDVLWVLLYNNSRVHTNFPAIRHGYYGFDATLLNQQQVLSIPFKDYELTQNEFKQLQLFSLSVEAKTFSFDQVQLFSNTNQPTTGGTPTTISRTSQIPINDGATGVSPYVQHNEIGLAAKTNNYADLDGLPTLLPFPAPFLEDLVPDSNLPGISGKIILIGAFFKPTMCLAENINTVNGILLQGQTILTAKFISDNRIDLDVTNSTIEGSYDITLNNGLSITYSDVYLLVLGTVITPIPTDYSNITGAVDITEGENILVSIANTSGSLKCDLQLDINDDFTYSFRWKASPLNPNPTAQQDYIIVKDSVTNSQIFKLRSYNNGGTYIYNSTNGLIKVFENAAHNFNTNINYKIKRTGTILQLMLDSTVAHTFDASVNDLVVNNLIVEHITQKLDRLSIRYISHNL
jgi:hypothetical protein